MLLVITGMLSESTMRAAVGVNGQEIPVPPELNKKDVLMAALVTLVDRVDTQKFSMGGDAGIQAFVAREGLTAEPAFVFIHAEIHAYLLRGICTLKQG
jgi:hypothetical protein